jgi:uncharacterized GH25 family protein
VSYCAKFVLNVQPVAGQEARPSVIRPGITSKTGQKVEVLPLVDPTRVAPGDDLPVRVYYEGIKVAKARVTASVVPTAGGDPINLEAAHPTDEHGTTRFRVSQGGTWTIRFVHEPPAGPSGDISIQRYVAELIFNVAEGGAK